MAKEIQCKRCGEIYWISKFKKCPRCGKRPHPFLTFVRIVVGTILLVCGLTKIVSVAPSVKTNTTKSGTVQTQKKETGNISLEEYNKIETGMTYEQCVEIIGGEGKLESENTVDIGGRLTTKMYYWSGESFMSGATLFFQDGKLTVKSQSGLE